MAVVYRAIDTLLDRQVALKLLHPHLAHDKESRARFHREAQSVAKLKHPNLLEIYDFSGADNSDEVFIVMELVQGTTLRRFLDEAQRSKVSAPAAALILQRVASALSHAHQHGIVHRDVKPENILIATDGVPKLSDFGIAHLVGRSDMTHTGQILGSPAYMSPEHLEHGELDARADIFSLGTVLYEMVCGSAPFCGKNPHAVIKQLIEGDYIDPLTQEPSVGRAVAEIIRRCLKPKVEDRYQNAATVATELELAVTSQDVPATDETLASFFADPAGWTLRHRPQIITATLAHAAATRKSGRYAEASEHFNCVLGLEPRNQEALEALVGMGRSQRLRKLAERTALTLPLLAVLLAGVWSVWGQGSPPEQAKVAKHYEPKLNAQIVPSVEHPMLEESSDIPESDTIAEDQVSPTPSLHTPRTTTGNRATTAVATTRQVVFTPHPMAVRITIDGKDSFDYGPAHRIRELPVGTHTVSFTPLDTKRFEPLTWTVEVMPGKGPQLIRERLRLRPGKLLVKSNLDTLVTVPGRGIGRTNTIFEVSLDNEPEKSVSILVSANGYAPQTRQVTISAGEQTTITVLLDRTEEVEAAAPTLQGPTAANSH